MTLPEPKSMLLDALNTPKGQVVARAFGDEFLKSWDFFLSWEKAAQEAERQGIAAIILLALLRDVFTLGLPFLYTVIQYIMNEHKRQT